MPATQRHNTPSRVWPLNTIALVRFAITPVAPNVTRSRSTPASLAPDPARLRRPQARKRVSECSGATAPLVTACSQPSAAVANHAGPPVQSRHHAQPQEPAPQTRRQNHLYRLAERTQPSADLRRTRITKRFPQEGARPFGSREWTQDTARRLGIEHTLRAPGRPQGSRNRPST